MEHDLEAKCVARTSAGVAPGYFKKKKRGLKTRRNERTASARTNTMFHHTCLARRQWPQPLHCILRPFLVVMVGPHHQLHLCLNFPFTKHQLQSAHGNLRFFYPSPSRCLKPTSASMPCCFLFSVLRHCAFPHLLLGSTCMLCSPPNSCRTALFLSVDETGEVDEHAATDTWTADCLGGSGALDK